MAETGLFNRKNTSLSGGWESASSAEVEGLNKVRGIHKRNRLRFFLHLMKIMRAGPNFGGVAEGVDALGEDGNDAFLLLESAPDFEEGFLGDEEPFGLEEGGLDEGIGDAGLVFETDETVAFGRAGSLSADDHTDERDSLTGRGVHEIGRRPGIGDALTDETHGMRADGEGGGSVVGLQSLDARHGAER